MARILVAVTLPSMVLVANGARAQPYGWTISASATDPYQNSLAFLPGLQAVSLWLACCVPEPGPGGMATAEFGICPDNSANTVVSFAPTNGFLNAGTATDLLLSVANCPCGPILAGHLYVLLQVPGHLCICESTDGIMGTVDCGASPTLWPIEWIGLSTNGQEPCGSGFAVCSTRTSVDDSSRGRATTWGRLKALYRTTTP